jgi:hypothetical protein
MTCVPRRVLASQRLGSQHLDPSASLVTQLLHAFITTVGYGTCTITARLGTRVMHGTLGARGTACDPHIQFISLLDGVIFPYRCICDLEAYALVLCKKLELLHYVLELRNDDLWQAAILLMLGIFFCWLFFKM